MYSVSKYKKGNQMTNAQYKELVKMIEKKEKEIFEKTHQSQRATDYAEGMKKMLDTIFFDYNDNEQ